MLKRSMRPSHAGSILSGVIEGLREKTGNAFTIKELAEGLGVNRRTLSLILNQKSGISPIMAVKLSEAFSTDADLWMNLQKKYDLWHAEQKVNRANIQHFANIDSDLQSA